MARTEADMNEPVYLSWLAVADIRVPHDALPSPATIKRTVAKLARTTEKDTALVVRPLSDSRRSEVFELVTGRREYEASQQLGRALIPCRIVDLTDGQSATLRRLDVLMGPGTANDLVRGWQLVQAANQHDWDRGDLTALLPTGRSRISEAWSAAQALPRERVVASCRAKGVSPEAVAELKRKEIRHLRDLSDEERVDALVAHLANPGESDRPLNGRAPGKDNEEDEPSLEELASALSERLRERAWTERAAYIVRLASTLTRWRW